MWWARPNPRLVGHDGTVYVHTVSCIMSHMLYQLHLLGLGVLPSSPPPTATSSGTDLHWYQNLLRDPMLSLMCKGVCH
jgi:hypothetical protein